MRLWGQKFTKNVLFSLYRHILENGDAENARLWFQFVEKWNYQKGNTEVPERKFEPVKFTIIEHKTTSSPLTV